jgi:alpha-L-rhamnosidase
MYNNARSLLLDYWGGMIRKGADTFWEVYDPTNDFLSPYNSAIINSYCHAWSCTPVYFLRKYGDALFQAKALNAKQ